MAPLPVGYRLPAGGLPSAAKALLVPENIRSGVHIKGGGLDVTGALTPAKEILTMGAGYMWRGGGGFFSWWCITSANSDYLDSRAGFREYPSGGSYVSTTATCAIKKSFVGHMASSVNVLRYNGAYVGTAPVEFLEGTNLEYVVPAGGERGFTLYKLLAD